MRRPLPISASVDVSLLLSRDAAPTRLFGVRLAPPLPVDSIDVRANVVRTEPGVGFGVHFLLLTPAHRQVLDRTVKLLQFGSFSSPLRPGDLPG